jgi:hypothetical protein
MIIDDDFLTKEEIENIEKLMIYSQEFPWYLNPVLNNKDYLDSVKYSFPNEKNIGDGFQFNHGFYSNYTKSSYFDLSFHIFLKFMTKHEIKSRSIVRCKANLTTQKSENSLISPHIDYHFDHKVFLYYVNDSDGDTIIYNETWSEEKQQSNLTEKCRVTPKSGRGILIDGLTYHSPQSPIITPFRAVINFVFV